MKTSTTPALAQDVALARTVQPASAMARVVPLLFVALASTAPACSDGPSTDVGEDDVTVDTSSPEARRQYDANVAFAKGYTSRCAGALEKSDRPRVLVTGFGRFMQIEDNATGRIVSGLVPEAKYPETQPPPAGEVDPPAPQVSVALGRLDLPGVGAVDVCAMILPVAWDLAAILIAKEVEAIAPSFVLMNGVANARQPLWIELGAVNRAARFSDGSDRIVPTGPEGKNLVRLVAGALPSEDEQGNLLSWRAVQTAAREVAARHARETDGDVSFAEILGGAELAGFPRFSNTYLCNNVTYVTGWLMTHPGREIRLLRASKPIAGTPSYVSVKLATSFANVPRVFVHWPSDLADKHRAASVDVMKAIIAAQLTAVRAGDLPTPGENALAAPSLVGGEVF